MQKRLSHNLAQSIAGRINHYAGKEGLEYTKMVFGLESFLINVSKLIIVYTFAILLGILPQTLITQGAFALLRRYSFGLHALKSTVCTIVSCCLFVFIPWLLPDAGIGNATVLAVFVPLIIIFYMYAPADTKARPLVGVQLRARMKKRAVICVVILMVAALIIPNSNVKLLMTLGAVYQCVSVLPLTYKILRRSEKNYEQYEKA